MNRLKNLALSAVGIAALVVAAVVEHREAKR